MQLTRELSQSNLIAHIFYLEGLLISNGIAFRSFRLNSQQHIQQPIKTIPPLTTNLRPDVLPRHLIERYSRQMLLKQIQLTGQLKLCQAKVAIIGCGGIGCPLAMYLAAAGVGTLGLFDNDKVELNNLHRQIGHKNRSIGMVKTESLKETLLELNPYDKINIHPFVTVDSVDSLEEYSLILDGSDNPECRYLVNDYCVQNSKIVISGACIGWEGQMVAYGNGSACYRCLWGDDELSHGGCSTRGVLGMLPGIVSMVVAVETIKFITMGRTDLSGSMLLYDGLTQMFRKVRLRNKRQDCIACGTSPIEIQQYDYSKYQQACLKPPPDVQSISWHQYISQGQGYLLDVRSQAMFNIVKIEPSVNLPYDKLKDMSDEDVRQFIKKTNVDIPHIIYVSCRKGNDSKRAVDHLLKNGFNAVNIKGGIEEYGYQFDPNIPYI